ncbi:MAG: FlgD immunoglobulin-like domain containing protein, partial [candidate division WOR-3 bacterium]
YGLYGLAYNPRNDRIYATHFRSNRIYVMSSDSFVTSLGTIPAPNNETACTDIKYCAYDNTFWVASNMTKRVYKIDTAGNVLRYFNNPAVDYPVGLGWYEPTRTLWLTDRRAEGVTPNYIYTTDTLGNQLRRISIPWVSYAGARTLAVDVTNTNPFRPTLIMLFTWFSAGPVLDSICVHELKCDTWEPLNKFRQANNGWNSRGVEYDPRDGNLWITIMQNNAPPPTDNSIYKVWGFHTPSTALEERPFLVATGDAMWCRAAPNPFSGRTMLSYLLPKATDTRLVIYDAAGRVIRTLADEHLPAGVHTAIWDTRDNSGRICAPGIYFFDLTTNEGKITGKALLLR